MPGLRRGFRSDIEGLRGVAVLVVVLFHLRLEVFAGGYVGVDVFFVISGYLITKQLIDHATSRTPGWLRTFWARRFRRLLPLATLTIALTLMASIVVFSPLEWQRLAQDARASLLYVANIAFARRGEGYFTSAESPFLHMWSLGVEEQFYLVWPFLVMASATLLPRWRTVRTRFTIVVTAVSALSFVLGFLLTERGTPWAFFSPVTRAWEFGVGALVALTPSTKLRHVVGRSISWLGVAGILAAVLTFDELTPMPGVAALLPVLATAALIFASEPGRLSVETVLTLRPLMTIGQCSYAWYLFHWPALVLTESVVGNNDLSPRLLAAGLSLMAAWAATRYVEGPVRRWRLLEPPVRMLCSAVAVAALLVAASFAVDRVATERLDEPFLSRLAQARAGRTITPGADCSDVEIGGHVLCVFGDPNGGRTVLLVGDSHAGQWAPALDLAAEQLGVRLIVRTYGGCPPMDIYVQRTGFTDSSRACRSFREETKRLIVDLSPDLVIVATADYRSRLIDGPSGSPLERGAATTDFVAATSQFADLIREADASLMVILDNPTQARDPIECLARGGSVSECSPSPEAARDAIAFGQVLRQALGGDEVPAFDAAALICVDVSCPVLVGDLIIYADGDHLSQEFTTAQVPLLKDLLEHSLSA